jgi:hypothetical protein
MLGRRGLRLGLAAAVAVLSAFFAAEAAHAGSTTISDGNDKPGLLDIRSASHGHSGATKVTHTIRTFGNWPIGLLGPSTPNFFSLEISTDGDRAPERIVLIFSSSGKMVAGVATANQTLVGLASATRPNGHTVRVVIRRALLGDPAGYRWQALSFYQASGGCGRGCLDKAPNRTRQVPHDLRAPTIAFPQPGVPASTSYSVGFSVSDTGGSGVKSWHLQRRPAGATTWATVRSGTSGGSKQYNHVGAQGQDSQFRIVAIDRHGNRSTSPVRTVSVPIDDASFTYTGTWSTGGSPGVDFLGTLHASSTASDAATVMVGGAFVALIAPGGAGVAEIRIDGVLEGTVDLSTFSGPRRVVFQKSLGSATSRAVEVRVVSGTFQVDGIIDR